MNSRNNLFKAFKDKYIRINRYTHSEKYKQNKILISRLGGCLLSLVVLIMATFTYAWLSMSHNTSTDSMQMVIKTPNDVIVSATVHDCIGKDDSGTYYFDKKAATANDLKKYMMLVENNRQLLLRIRFEEPDAAIGISLTASTDTTYFMGDGQHPLNASEDGRGEEYDNAISSIIAFYIVDCEDAAYESDAAYKVTSFGTPYSFVDKTDFSITNFLTLIDKQNISEINIVIDYVPELVNKVFSENLGNSAFERPDGSFFDEVFYVWDIKLEMTKE